MPQLPSFPAPNLRGVINAVKEIFNDIMNEGTGSITQISQAVLDVWEMDCGGKWIVYVHTGVVAAKEALWLLITPSLDEVFENYLEPKQGRRHGRRGQRGDRTRRAINANAYRLFFKPPIPDVDHGIADLLPGRRIHKGRRLGPGEWVFWTSINVADAILWHWLLIQAAETFTVTWMSEIMESGECQHMNDGTAKFTTPTIPMDSKKEFWKNRADLTGLYEENMSVSHHSFARMVLSNVEGHGLTIVLCHFEVDRTGMTGEFHFTVGAHLTVTDPWGTVIAEKTQTTTIFCPEDSKAAASLDVALITEEFHTVAFEYIQPEGKSDGHVSFNVHSDVGITVRSVKVA